MWDAPASRQGQILRSSRMVSIIVPVYNAASYIEETVASVISQTFTDWELILVNDCSPDNSLSIIQALASQDPRIRVIDKKQNEGAAKARNTGLEAAKGRYIAFLDADDIWRPEKLQMELQYMQRHNAGFVFSAYEFGDEHAIPTGKACHVPTELSYRQALSRTIIFTSTTLFDTQIVSKELLQMPAIGSEDTATWWRILRTGIKAYGLDRPLVVYRRPAKSLSSNKGVAVKRIWNLYRNVAQMGPISAALHLFGWAWRSTVRRVIDDTIYRHIEAAKRLATVQLALIGLLMYTAVYAVGWFKEYYPIVSSFRVSQEGYELGYGLKLYFRGHLLILLIYFVLLMFFSRSGDGMRIGHIKPTGIFTSTAFTLVAVNLLSYFQISLMRNWLVPIEPILIVLTVQLAIAAVWSGLSNTIYCKVFPPRELLVIGNDNSQGSKIAEQIQYRQDRFLAAKVMTPADGLEAIKEEALKWYGGVVIGNLDAKNRMDLLNYSYRHYLRAYLVPDLEDLLLQGAEQMDLLGTPWLELKEYSIRWEERIVKRTFDIIGSLVLLVAGLPVACYRVLHALNKKNKLIISQDTCVLKNKGRFIRYEFSEDGVGKSWPTLLNVLKGQMSLIGPKAMTENEANELAKISSWSEYRFRVKPGVISYAELNRTDNSTKQDLLKMDLYYIQHCSLALDFRLLLRSLR